MAVRETLSQRVLGALGYARRPAYLASKTGSTAVKTEADKSRERFLMVHSTKDLEAVYRDPLVRAALYARMTLILKNGFETVIVNRAGKEDTVSKTAKGNVDQFFRDSDLDGLLRSVITAKDVYGKGALELKYDDPAERNELLGLSNIVDIVNFDYQRDSTQNIIKDVETQKPVGFVQKTPTNPVSGIKFEPEQVAFFYNNPFGGYEPYSILDPIYNATENKMNIECGIANAIYHTGFPTLDVTVGTPDDPAMTEKEITDERAAVENLAAGQDIYVHDQRKQLKLVYPPSLRDIQSGNDYSINQIATGLMIPAIYLMGVADVHATTISEESRQYFIDVLQGEQKILGRTIESQIMARFFKTNFPKINWDNYRWSIEWPELSTEDMDAMAVRHNVYAQYGILTNDEMREEMGYEPREQTQETMAKKKVKRVREYDIE